MNDATYKAIEQFTEEFAKIVRKYMPDEFAVEGVK